MITDHATCDKMEDVEKLNGRVFTDQVLPQCPSFCEIWWMLV